MPSSTTWLAVGVVAGVGIGVGAALLWQRSGSGSTAGAGGAGSRARASPGPTVTEHTVLRDQQGRIQTVQTIEGVGTVRGNGHHQHDQPPEMDRATDIHFD